WPRDWSSDVCSSDLAPGTNLVQRLRPERGGLRELGTDLLHVFPPALLDLVLEELRQRAVAQSLLTLLRMIHDEIRHQRPRQPARLLLGILHHERIHGPERARHPLTGPSAGGRGRSSRRRRRRGGARCRGRRSARRRCGRRCNGSHGWGCRRRGGAWGGRRRGAGRGGGGGGAGGRGATAGPLPADTAAVAAATDAFTGNTLLHTAQRARTPPAGTLAGSTRYTVSHDGQVTFI